MTVAARIAQETGINLPQIEAVCELISDGCTVPFIARYRKELTGALDEVQIAAIRDRSAAIAELDSRRSAILSSLTERDILTDELQSQITGAKNMTALEDIYLPYRPKRRTRASIATERGLFPLADALMAAAYDGPDMGHVSAAAESYVSGDVPTSDDALAGARDIIAERVSENRTVRARARISYVRQGVIKSSVAKGMEEEGQKYASWFEWSERAAGAPSHRVLAMMRGEREGVLSVSAQPDSEAPLISEIERIFIKRNNGAAEHVRAAIKDGYKRLLAPSMETELKNAIKSKADREAVAVFAKNVSDVLMSAPLGGKAVLAVDPGLRTGCKVCALGEGGEFLESRVFYLHKKDDAARTMREMAEKYPSAAVAVGNGTGGREAFDFIDGLYLCSNPILVQVSENGASVYSASEVAREEFPHLDLTVRGAVSIGRRLQDPLAELVKIDPKSLGVGQYQHDVDQKILKSSLDDVVSFCVNSVGVNLNTASKHLLSYVSGLGPALAAGIVAYRASNGPFRCRRDVMKVPRLGPKAYQQAAGFLRVPLSPEPLDASAVHPERYDAVRRMAGTMGADVKDLMGNEERLKLISIEDHVTEDLGPLTLRDILDELAKPSRDPRRAFEAVQFDPNIREISDLAPGMVLSGVVSNVAAFGAFVDIGVHCDGLLHKSRIPKGTQLSPGQPITVTVSEIDKPRRRISLNFHAGSDSPPL